MKYCLYRIIGNQIPVVHGEDSVMRELAFVLANEPDFPDCEKRFLLNRIHDQNLCDQYKHMITYVGHKWEEIYFSFNEFNSLLGMKSRAQYVTNVNVARNTAIQYGKEIADYVLAFDGASIFRQDGWDAFNINVRHNSDPFFVVGQWRPETHLQLETAAPILKEAYRSEATSSYEKVSLRELAVVFGPDSDILYNEDLMYGDRDKAELLCRLGVPGIWERWCADMEFSLSKSAGTVKMAGWVARLPPQTLDTAADNLTRANKRQEGVCKLVEGLNGICRSIVSDNLKNSC